MELAVPSALLLGFLMIPFLLALRLPRSAAVALPTLAGLQGVRPTARQRIARLLPLLRVAAVVLLVLAVARPRIAEAEAVAQGEGIDIALAVDLSSSMGQRLLVDESRLEVAKSVIRDFITGREDDRIGIVIFQQDALGMAPLSLDYEALDAIVADLESGLLPDGTGIGVGIAEALNLLRDSPASSRIVILLTDGEHNARSISPEEAVGLASALNIRVYTIGIKTSIGNGTVRADFDEGRLKALSESTGASYFAAESESDLADVYDEIGRLEKSRVGREGFQQYREFGPWLALIAASLLIVDIGARATVFRRTPS